MQGVWRSKKFGYKPDPTLYPILMTLVPLTGAVLSFFLYTSWRTLAKDPEVQILGKEPEPYLSTRPGDHFVSRRKAKQFSEELERRMEENTKPNNEGGPY